MIQHPLRLGNRTSRPSCGNDDEQGALQQDRAVDRHLGAGHTGALVGRGPQYQARTSSAVAMHFKRPITVWTRLLVLFAVVALIFGSLILCALLPRMSTNEADAITYYLLAVTLLGLPKPRY
jgi:hypothetical protein